jgi:hypothetical protein
MRRGIERCGKARTRALHGLDKNSTDQNPEFRMQYFVTGATGFIGKRLVKALLQRRGATVFELLGTSLATPSLFAVRSP